MAVVGVLLTIVVFIAQVAGVAILIGAMVAFMGRTRRAAVLWLLAVITRRRLPLITEVEALGDGVLSKDRGRVGAAVVRLRGGASLAEALSATPGLVPDESVLIAHVGERSGRIGDALTAEAERLVRVREMAAVPVSSPSLAMLYLVAVPIVIPVIVTGLMIFIVPKYKKIFDDFGSRLPWITDALIKSSDAVSTFWYLGAATILVLILPAGLLWFSARSSGWSLGLPWWTKPGGSARRASLALRALAVPAASERPFDDALGPLSTFIANPFDRARFSRVRERYAAGVELWDTLAAERIVSRRDAELLAAAERAGNLTWALHLVADRYDERRRRRLAALLEVAQPAIVIALGAVVLFICLGFFLPLIQLINDLS